MRDWSTVLKQISRQKNTGQSCSLWFKRSDVKKVMLSNKGNFTQTVFEQGINSQVNTVRSPQSVCGSEADCIVYVCF